MISRNFLPFVRRALSLLIPCLFFAPGIAAAQTDLSMHVEINPGTRVISGEGTVADIIVRNNGAHAAPAPRVSISFPLVGNGAALSFSVVAQTAPCVFSTFVIDGLPGQPATKGALLQGELLPPATELRCSIGFDAPPDATGVASLRFYATSGGGVVDTDISNNEQNIILQLGSSPPTTAAVSVPAYNALALLLMVVGFGFVAKCRFPTPGRA